MTDKTKNIVAIGIGIAIVGITSFLIIRKMKNVPKTQFRRRSVKYAKDEYKKWQEGKTKETQKEIYDDLKKYWESIGWNESQWSPTGTAWSSAFISYLMKKSRARDDFKYASSHSEYIRDAIKNRKEDNKNKFKGYKLTEQKVELGDLVCFARQDGVTYDTNSYYSAHCDIVTKIDGDTAYGIGGNVSDSVSVSKIPLSDGYVKSGNRRFVVIKTK